MAGKGAVFIQILGDSTGLTAATTKAQASLAGLEAKTSSAGLASTGFGKVSTVAFLAAGAAVVGFAAVSIKAYEQHQVALNKLQSVMHSMPTLVGASTDSFVNQAQALQKLTGANHDEVLSADAVLGAVGLTQKQIEGMNLSIIGAARFMGSDIPEAAGIMTRALQGNSRGLRQLGITFHATGNIAKDYTSILGQLKTRGFDQLAISFGQTLPGKIAIFQGALHNLEETSGKALLPIVSGMVSALTSLVSVFGPVAQFLPVILAGFAGFAALRYLPGLLTSIGLKLAALPIVGADIFGTAALGAQGFGLAVAGALPEVAALAGAVFLLGKMYTAGNIKITTYNQALRVASEQLGRGASAAQIAVRAHEILNRAVGRELGPLSQADLATFKLATQQQAAAQQTNKLADALVKEQNVLTQLAGGFLGVRGAALSVRSASLSYDQAVQQLHKDQRTAGTSALQLRQDQLAVSQAMVGRVQAQVSLTDSIQKFTDQELASGRSTKEVIAEVKGFARQAGLTKKQTDDLINTVIQLAIKYGQLPKNVKTNVFAPGLDSVGSKIQSVTAGLINMTRRQWIVNVQYHSGGMTPTIKNNALGGVARGLSWVGERGPELVNFASPARVYTHQQSMAMASGGGGDTYNVYLNVEGSVIRERDLIENVRRGLIQIGRRNGGAQRLGLS